GMACSPKSRRAYCAPSRQLSRKAISAPATSRSSDIAQETCGTRRRQRPTQSDCANAMNIYDEPKIDCHNHVFDPARFPYAADTAYRPAGQEIGNAPYFVHVLDAYGVRYALVVGPNSGYGTDNRCLLDAIARSGGRFKGIAVVS